MMTARFVAGAFLFALLIVDICCVPLQKDGGHGGGADAGNFGGGGGGGGLAAVGVGAGAGVTRPAVPVLAAAPSGAGQGGGAAGGAAAAYGVGSGPGYAAGGVVPVAGYRPGPEDFDWSHSPDLTSSAPGGVGPGGPGVISSQSPLMGTSSSGPTWQGGELAHSEFAFEHGDYKYETEEQGSPVFPPYGGYAGAPGVVGVGDAGGGAGAAGGVVLGVGVEGAGGAIYPGYPGPGPWPYPSFDWRFLTGQYPPGTVSYGSSDYEEGTDRWREAQFVKYLATLNRPSDPVKGKGGKGGKGQQGGGLGGGARVGFRQPAGGAHGGFRQPGGMNVGANPAVVTRKG